jgi:cytochrome c oxidase subunit 1
VATYQAEAGFTWLNLLATIGAGFISLGMLAFLSNIAWSVVKKRRAGPDPWQAHTLEWATSSPPPERNFTAAHPLPPITSNAPLLDLRKRESALEDMAAPAGAAPGSER